MKERREELEQAIAELRDAMLENIHAAQIEEQAKAKKTKAHFRLIKAKENLRALEFV